ncbi:MAG: hypothetical protein SFU98_07295 [Leptospiraceae bacterium]|nr:hypothetical protein [Leptospiraceae bacterium]
MKSKGNFSGKKLGDDALAVGGALGTFFAIRFFNMRVLKSENPSKGSINDKEKANQKKDILTLDNLKHVGVPAAVYVLAEYFMPFSKLKGAVQIGAGLSLVSGGLQAANLLNEKEYLGFSSKESVEMSGDPVKTIEFNGAEELRDFANALLPAEEQTIQGNYLPEPFSEIDGDPVRNIEFNGEEDYRTVFVPEVNGEDEDYKLIMSGEGESDLSGDFN